MSHGEELHSKKAPQFPSAPAPAPFPLPFLFPEAVRRVAFPGEGKSGIPLDIRAAPRPLTQLPVRAAPPTARWGVLREERPVEAARGWGGAGGRRQRGEGAPLAQSANPPCRGESHPGPGAPPPGTPRTHRAGVTRGGCGCGKRLLTLGISHKVSLPRPSLPPGLPGC